MPDLLEFLYYLGVIAGGHKDATNLLRLTNTGSDHTFLQNINKTWHIVQVFDTMILLDSKWTLESTSAP